VRVANCLSDVAAVARSAAAEDVDRTAQV
jgi:hypothetical protein